MYLFKQIYKRDFERGQTIIEAAIALSSILVVMIAVAIAVTTSLNNSEFIKNQSLASKFAQEAMERVRYIKNNDIISFAGYSGTYCMFPNNTLGNNSDCTEIGNGNQAGAQCTRVCNYSGASLIREVDFASSAPSEDCSSGKRVTVNVYWSSGKCPSNNRYCHKTQLISCFANPTSSGTSL